MAFAVVTGATCMCSFGTVPCALIVTSQMKFMISGRPMATIQDNTLANLPTFGMCTTPSNPAVVAALGSPVPCSYMQTGPWIPAQTQKLAEGKPLLTNTCTCMCAYAGVISIVYPGQEKETI